MATRASIARHPIHPMLIVFPLGLWVFYCICELVYFLTNRPPWGVVATYSLVGGIIGAVLAAIPGFIDFMQLKESRHGTVILWHMIANIVALTLFIVVFFLRWRGTEETAIPLILSGAALLFLIAGGWLGGRIVYIHGVGVSARRGHRESGEASGESKPPVEKEKGPRLKEPEPPADTEPHVEEQMHRQRESRQSSPSPEPENKEGE